MTSILALASASSGWIRLRPLAFAVALCSGLDPLRCSFTQAQMRSHLLTCFESQQISPFPVPYRHRRLAHKRVLLQVYLFTVSVGCHGIGTIKKGPFGQMSFMQRVVPSIIVQDITDKASTFYCDFCIKTDS